MPALMTQPEWMSGSRTSNAQENLQHCMLSDTDRSWEKGRRIRNQERKETEGPKRKETDRSGKEGYLQIIRNQGRTALLGSLGGAAKGRVPEKKGQKGQVLCPKGQNRTS